MTKRKEYIDKEVLKSCPKVTGKLEFFNVGRCITKDELEEEYKKRNLIPASYDLLYEYEKEYQKELDKMGFVGTHWKDARGNQCYATFGLWFNKRKVYVRRSDSDWGECWWFAGVKKKDVRKPLELSPIKAWAIRSKMSIEGLDKGTIISIHKDEPVSSLPAIFEVVEGEFIIKE